MVILLRFLHDFALPWLRYLRNGVRTNSPDRIDFIWSLALPGDRGLASTVQMR